MGTETEFFILNGTFGFLEIFIDSRNYQRKISPKGCGSFLESKNDCGNQCRATVDFFGQKSGAFARKILRHFGVLWHRFYTGNGDMAEQPKQGHRRAGVVAQYTGPCRTVSTFRARGAPRAHRTRTAAGTLAPGPAGMIYMSNDLILC